MEKDSNAIQQSLGSGAIGDISEIVTNWKEAWGENPNESKFKRRMARAYVVAPELTPILNIVKDIHTLAHPQHKVADTPTPVFQPGV